MNRKLRTIAATTAIIGAFAVASTLHAAGEPDRSQPHEGMMGGMQGDHRSMMNMMQQMSQMMERCNAMMKDMRDDRSSKGEPDKTPKRQD